MAKNILAIIHTIGERAVRFFSFPCCTIQLPWFKTRDDSIPVNHLRRLVFACHWKSHRKIISIAEAFLWPIKATLLACHNVIKYGMPVKKKHGINEWKQLGQMLYLANFYNISPNLYYIFRFFKKGPIEKAVYYLQNFDMHVLFSELNKDTNTGIIDDKARFLRQCIAYGLPVPSVAALFYDDGKEEWLECQPHDLPSCDLFLKFTNSSCGKGAEGWAYEGGTKVWRRGLLVLDKVQLIHYCREKSFKNKKPVMVQQRLVNHKEIAPFSSGALCTFRVTTYLMPGGKANLLLAGLKMPVGKMDVDNLAAGGIASGIDLEKGVLGPASGKKSAGELLQRHPDTHAEIVGHRLTCWPEIVNISIKAHECFRKPCFIGWDIAMTTRGPVIIEGNTIHCFELSQMLLGKPLGETIFPSLYLKASQKRI